MEVKYDNNALNIVCIGMNFLHEKLHLLACQDERNILDHYTSTD